MVTTFKESNTNNQIIKNRKKIASGAKVITKLNFILRLKNKNNKKKERKTRLTQAKIQQIVTYLQGIKHKRLEYKKVLKEQRQKQK